MSQRLYRVRVERAVMLVVIAASESEAERIAYDTIESGSDGLCDEDVITDASLLTNENKLPSGWDKQSLPFGTDKEGERTIATILSVQP